MDKPLTHPPIVEAVVDIDCDLSPRFSLRTLEADARKVFSSEYPNFQAKVFQEHQIEQQGDTPPKHSARREIASLMFLASDKKQLVQVRTQGFSFNRLEPYSSLDDYLPEIKRAWLLYRQIAAPLQVRAVRLRYINRIRLPEPPGESLDLSTYLDVHPLLRNEGEYTFRSFFNQSSAVEDATGNELNVVLASQPEKGHLPIILDITATKAVRDEPEDWDAIRAVIDSLRELKNRVFENILTGKCLGLFQ